MVKIKLFILTLLFGAALFAQDVKVKASTDSTNYFVGDYINYKLEIYRPENVKIFMPLVEDSLKVMEFIKKDQPVSVSSGNVILDKYTYTFSVYDSTDILVPSFKIGYKVEGDSTLRSLATNEFYIFVDKLQVNLEKDFLDIKAPLLIPFDMVFALLIILGVVLLAALIFFGYRYISKKKNNGEDNAPVIIAPPFEEAYGSLKTLEGKELWQGGAVKEYHSEITFIIRKYFERSFNFLALEMPSSEVIDNLKNIKECETVFDDTRDFFNNADMVKFAKFVPMNSVNEEMMKQAYKILEKTKPAPVEENKEDEVQNV
ncbi:MAG: hypothetical protein ACEPO8_09745 [Rhodothermaceae bacterium]